MTPHRPGPAPGCAAPGVAESHEIWALVNAEKATVGEIRQHWDLGVLFDAIDAMDHYQDVATWLRPKPTPQG